jgi:AcrR family transcriptional regulator
MIGTALAVIEDRAKALSMRTPAQRLDSGTATLYRHFSSRADLLAHALDAVLGVAVQPGAQPVGDECQTRQSLAPKTFPATASVAEFLLVPVNREFDFGLELILDGLAHRLARS